MTKIAGFDKCANSQPLKNQFFSFSQTKTPETLTAKCTDLKFRSKRHTSRFPSYFFNQSD